MNKSDLIQKVKALDGLNPDERAYLLNLVNTKKKYGLVWEDKPEAVEEQLRENLPVLNEVKERAIIKGDQYPNHILIEGDNLHALTALNFTHEGKIDVIYIDPPYNTGNKDFYYNDDYVLREDGYRHSKWLSYMSKRLHLAKSLLNENGLIFISIDDNEQSQLKLLCDEVFSDRNFVNTICHKSRHSVSNDLIISENHNFLLFYSKNFQNTFDRRKMFRVNKEIDPTLFKNPDNDPRGPYKIHPVDGPGGAKKGNPYYEFMGISGYWRYSKETMQQYYDDGEIVVRKKTLGRKYYLSKALENNNEAVTTWWDDVGTTTDGTKLLKDIISDCDFNNPKPIGLLEKILNLSTDNTKSFTVLDFFAGSGTTLHATMKINNDDGGMRQCILVTNNENNICEEVTYERNKKVIQGYRNAKGVQVGGLSSNNLRYYKSQFVTNIRSEVNNRNLTQLSTDLLCIKEDCFVEIKDEQICDIKSCRIFTNGRKKYLVVIYYNRDMIQVFEKINEFIKTVDTNQKVRLYAFSPEKEIILSELQEVEEKIEAMPLPDAIYNAYRATLRVLDQKMNHITSFPKAMFDANEGDDSTSDSIEGV